MNGQAVDHWIACARAATRAVAIVAMTTMLAIVVTSGAVAQTLTEPNPQPKSPPATAKALPAGHAKSCGAYGAGFVQMPGTDGCIKIGGYVTVQSGSNR